MTNYWKQMKIDASDMSKSEQNRRKEAYEKHMIYESLKLACSGKEQLTIGLLY